MENDEQKNLKNLSNDLYYENMLKDINSGENPISDDDKYRFNVDSFNELVRKGIISDISSLTLKDKEEIVRYVREMTPYFDYISNDNESDDFSYTLDELQSALASYLAALKKYQDKIDSLSEEEKKRKQDEIFKIYRDSGYKGAIEDIKFGPVTGIPSIDQPWNDIYNVDVVSQDIPMRTMYTDLIENTKNFPNSVALNYMGNRITYAELIKNIDKTAAALVKDGVKKGDVVSICMPYLPETIYTIYALNKIGAICNIIDPRVNENLICQYVSKAGSDYAIVIDKKKFNKKMDYVVSNVKLRKVVSVSPLISHGNSVLRRVSNTLSSKKYTKWEDLFSSDLSDVRVETSEFKEKQHACSIFTSGTSGSPKGVKLSNESFCSLSFIQQQMLKNKVGDKFLLIMPPFIAYGLVIGMHNMLCQGQELVMIPNFRLDKAKKMLPKLMKKHQPQYIMGVPNFLLAIMQYGGDLSFLKGLIFGGDKLSEEYELRANEFLKKKNCDAKIFVGWGMTEVSSCGSFSKTDAHRQLGSVGYPIMKSNVKILAPNADGKYDIDGPELMYGQTGVLFIKSPAVMLDYFADTVIDRQVIYTDKNGDKWINTEDRFSIDLMGNLFFKGRLKRIVVRPDGHNIPTNQIESLASSNPNVEEAVVVGLPSLDYPHGSVAAVCIKPSVRDKEYTKAELESLIFSIKDKINSNLQMRDRPKYYIIVDEIPNTTNFKVDYNKLVQIASGKRKELNLKNEGGDDVTYNIIGSDFKTDKNSTSFIVNILDLYNNINKKSKKR